MDMDIHAVPCLNDNYAYLLVDASGRTVIVDPSEPGPVLAAIQARSLTPVGIWATHHHHDHVGGIAGLLDVYPRIEVVGSVYDSEHGRIPHLTHAVGPDDALWFESRRVRLLFVPGHTLGAVAYVCDGAVFSGDTLFSSGCGRMFEGTQAVMQASMAQFRELPAETRVYSGHEYTAANLKFAQHIEPHNDAIAARIDEVQLLRAQGKPSVPSSIEQERAANPFLRWDVPEVIERARSLGAKDDSPAEVFGTLRRAKDKF